MASDLATEFFNEIFTKICPCMLRFDGLFMCQGTPLGLMGARRTFANVVLFVEYVWANFD